jgi:hypothetical protein
LGVPVALAVAARLAAEGDKGTKDVVDQMKRQGVNLNPPKQ